MSELDKSLLHPPDPFLYCAAVVRVVTPVAYDLHIDVGFRMSREVRISLRGAKLPDGFDRSDPTGDQLHDITNWFAAAAAADMAYPLYIRTYKLPDPSDHDHENGEIYAADIVRRTDAGNLRKWLLNRYPDMENGVAQDGFDFFRGGNGLPTSDRWQDEERG